MYLHVCITSKHAGIRGTSGMRRGAGKGLGVELLRNG